LRYKLQTLTSSSADHNTVAHLYTAIQKIASILFLQ